MTEKTLQYEFIIVIVPCWNLKVCDRYRYRYRYVVMKIKNVEVSYGYGFFVCEAITTNVSFLSCHH